MADLREQLSMLRDLGVRTAHFGADGQLMSVTFGDGGQGENDEEDDEEEEGAHAKMARAAAAVLTGKAKTLEKAIEAQ
jgi:hypothetical protein